jgi:hypothetical protein
MATILKRDDAPDSLKRALTVFGGKNMYHRPIWRLVRAEYRTHVCGGTLTEGKNGGSFEFQPNGKFSVSSFDPGRAISGPNEIPMYTCGPGWILERWMPAHVWGNRDDWNNFKAADGQRLFGDYPSEGDYWMMDGPWNESEPPPMSFLEKTIAVHEYCRNNQNQGFEHLLAQQIQDEKIRAEAQYLKMMDDIEAIGREVNDVLKSGSLAAQAVRQQAAKMRGDRSHQAL